MEKKSVIVSTRNHNGKYSALNISTTFIFRQKIDFSKHYWKLPTPRISDVTYNV